MHVFDRDMEMTGREPSVFRGTVSDNWSINGNPNGGYLMALVARAMLLRAEKKGTPIVTANFISRSVPGEAEIRVEEVARSKQYNRYEARLFQEGQEKIRALGTFLDEKIECLIDRYETGAPEMAPLEECVPLPPLPNYTILDNIDMRLDPACAGWMRGKLTGRSEQKGWIRFRDDRPFDAPSLFLAADSFPPPVFANQGMAAWVPTIELSVNLRNAPRTPWLRCSFRTRFITCGLLESDGEIWDGEENLVALSRQIAQFRKAGA